MGKIKKGKHESQQRKKLTLQKVLNEVLEDITIFLQIALKKIVKERKFTALVAAVLIWYSCASMAIERPLIQDESGDATESVESINRIEVEGWKPDVRPIRDDGTINRVIVQCQAEWIAKVLYGTAKNNSVSQKETAVWCIINRMESKWYPNTIEEVCKQNYQWKGFEISNPIKDDLLTVALTVLYEYYETGYKPCDCSYVYMEATNSDVVLRDSFYKTDGTKYWRCENPLSKLYT